MISASSNLAACQAWRFSKLCMRQSATRPRNNHHRFPALVIDFARSTQFWPQKLPSRCPSPSHRRSCRSQFLFFAFLILRLSYSSPFLFFAFLILRSFYHSQFLSFAVLILRRSY